jgi:hypothetical protein
MMLETHLTDSLARLQQAPLGKALYSREQADDGRWETVWLVREAAGLLAALGAQPAVEFRADAFDEGGVVVLPILLRLGTEASGCVYDTWINAYQIEGENVYLQDLARQDRIRIHLYDDASQPLPTLTTPNHMQGLVTTVLDRQASYQPSTEAAFAYARERFLAKYTGLEALWHVLRPR